VRQKLKRFEANKHSRNILEPGKPLFNKIKGKWDEKYFKNDHPIVVELGCGNGEYTTGLAEQNPQTNYVGVDIKGDRLFVGSQHAMEKNLRNVAFLRTSVHHLEDHFSSNELDEIWITFPDPRPKGREEKRRLTHPRFLHIYRNILSDAGFVKLKTDNSGFFQYTLDLLQRGEVKVNALEYTWDLDSSYLLPDHFEIETKYERIWKSRGSKSKYLKFQFEKCN
jgi:tRNA (guanine-N7-)-methyltransferase